MISNKNLRYQYKKQYLLNKMMEADYLYMSSSLKDSFTFNDEIVPAFKDGSYKTLFFRFIDNLAMKTGQQKLSCKYMIVEGSSGKAAELRIIIRCPKDWPKGRFAVFAQQEWTKNPSVDTLIYLDVHRSIDMDLSFLEPDWNGRIRAS